MVTRLGILPLAVIAGFAVACSSRSSQGQAAGPAGSRWEYDALWWSQGTAIGVMGEMRAYSFDAYRTKGAFAVGGSDGTTLELLHSTGGMTWRWNQVEDSLLCGLTTCTDCAGSSETSGTPGSEAGAWFSSFSSADATPWFLRTDGLEPGKPFLLLTLHEQVVSEVPCETTCTCYPDDPSPVVYPRRISPVPSVVAAWAPARAGTYSGELVTQDGSLRWGVVLQLRCVAGCERLECRASCDDGNPCTTDDCVEGSGCRHAERTGWCVVDACQPEGRCVAGRCEQGPPVPCDDGNVCTEDFCTPLHGCVNLEKPRFVSNASPTDCVFLGCSDGVLQELPITETPVQASPTDCELQVCSDGVVLTADAPSECP